MSAAQILHVSGQEISDGVTTREYLRLLNCHAILNSKEICWNARNRRANGMHKMDSPFIATCRVELENVGSDTVRLADGMDLHSLILARRMQAGAAHALAILTVSAGPEVSQEVSQMWATGRPDEAFFLDRFAVGVTERLIFWASATICRNSEATGKHCCHIFRRAAETGISPININL